MDQYLFDAEGNSWAFFGTQVSRQGQDGLTQGPIAELTIRHNSVRDVVEGPQRQHLYALTDYRKVDRYLDGQWTPLWTPADTFQNYFYIMEMKLDDAGNLWLSTMEGLFKWDGQSLGNHQ